MAGYNVGLGLTGFLGFGKESTYGTPVARTNFLEINSEAMETTEQVIESAALASVGIRDTKRAQGAVGVSGSFDFDAQYSGWERLCTQVMGAISSQQPDPTNFPTVWQHTITIADQLPTSTTVEVFRGTENFVTEPNKSYVYAGCVLSDLMLSCKVDDLLKVQFTMMGQQEARQAKSTPVYATDPLAVFHQGNVFWNTGNALASDFSISFKNNLQLRPVLGSRFTRQPVRGGKLSVDVTMTLEFISWDMYDDFRNATERVFKAQFIGPIAAGGFFKQITINIPIGIVNSHKVNLKSPGRVEAAIGFKAYRDSSGGLEMNIVFQNLTSASLVN